MIKNWSLTQNLRTAHRKRGKKPRNYTKLLACKHCEMWKLADVSPAGVCYPPTPGPRVKCPLSLPWGTNTGRHGNILHYYIITPEKQLSVVTQQSTGMKLSLIKWYVNKWKNVKMSLLAITPCIFVTGPPLVITIRLSLEESVSWHRELRAGQ